MLVWQSYRQLPRKTRLDMFPPAVILLNPHNQLNAIALKHTQIGIKNSLGGNVCAAEVFTSVPKI
jgi:hypothetical protein